MQNSADYHYAVEKRNGIFSTFSYLQNHGYIEEEITIEDLNSLNTY